MIQFNENLEQALSKFPFNLQDDDGMDAPVAVMYRNPHGRGVWLVTEAKRLKSGDWALFCFCHIFCWEWGDMKLSQLENIKDEIGLERVIFTERHPTVSELVKKLRVD